MQQKRKTNLFRFVTVRAPQLISAERRALGFVEHPDSAGSHFLNAISAITDLALARATLGTQLGSFIAWTKVDDVKALSSDLWDFSLWLAKNKNNLVRSELDALIPSPLPNATKILKLWDNLFYDVLKKKNAPLRQACLQTIVAINFINNYVSYSPGVTTDKDEKEVEAKLLKRLANGKVVVDRAFTIAKSAALTAPVGIEAASHIRHEAMHKANLESLKIAPLEALRNEFCSLEKIYKSERKTAYDTQYGTYKQQVKTTIDQYITQNNIQEPDIEGQIPFGVINEFHLAFDAPLSASYTQGKLTTEAIAYVNTQCLEENTISDVMNRVDNNIRIIKERSTQSQSKRFNEVLIKGVVVKPSSSVHHEYGFTLNTNKGSQGNSVDVYLTVSTGYNGGFIKNSVFKINVGGTNHTHSDLDIIHADSKTIFAKISFGTLSGIGKNDEFVFTGNFDFSNDKTMTMTRTGLGGGKSFNGTLFTVRNVNGQVELYGVNRIGVADYRRVEQELCCYVAGEVSHIENILAKEYKEKSTRQLTRSETSLEYKSERESEELTDTTSTTRHEMSSEISEIINKDRNANLGFSAGASGKYAGKIEWNTNVNGSFAFGHSTSNSNSEARTYAEDVTLRALERIVQKTSITRTSKVIKEYEENNKHGFDNREGVNHVTGVYRWVDKVYKNKIVNYGKRLMYEFMVPEPAKFYKEAILFQAEEEDVPASNNDSTGSDTLVPKPVPPKERKIIDANSITRENYKDLTSHYGADVVAPMAAEINVTKPYTQAIGNGDAVHAFSYPDRALQVPALYRCVKVFGTLNGNYRAKRSHSAFLKLSAGGSWQVTGLSGEGMIMGATNTIINITGLNIEGSIDVTISTRKIVGFNISLTAKCVLNDSEFSQWQQDVYQAIMKKYEEQLRAFKDAEEASKKEDVFEEQQAKDERVASNSGFNADIMTTELKRLCIEMITQPFGIDQGKDFYRNGECDIPMLNLTDELDTYTSYVKFFEQAFDWNLMSSLFYPYYWAKKCDWKALFQANDGNDHVFRAFLKSGMGRVVVPVREGFEDAVTYFMETGEIWNGIGMAFATDDELYLSIMDETTLIEGDVEGEEWETVVPSSLTIVQARSVLLDDEGLPCCETDAAVLAELNIKADTNTLSLKSDPPV